MKNLVVDIGFEPMNVRVKVVCLHPNLANPQYLICCLVRA